MKKIDIFRPLYKKGMYFNNKYNRYNTDVRYRLGIQADGIYVSRHIQGCDHPFMKLDSIKASPYKLEDSSRKDRDWIDSEGVWHFIFCYPDAYIELTFIKDDQFVLAWFNQIDESRFIYYAYDLAEILCIPQIEVIDKFNDVLEELLLQKLITVAYTASSDEQMRVDMLLDAVPDLIRIEGLTFKYLTDTEDYKLTFGTDENYNLVLHSVELMR